MTAFLLMVVAYGLVSRRAQGGVLSAPLVFTLAGVAVALAGAAGRVEREQARLFGELALATMLFANAARRSPWALLPPGALSLRLVWVAMPLTVLAGVLAARWLLPSLGLLEACIVATVLAPSAGPPTGLVNTRDVPDRVRLALELEAVGADPIAVTLLTLFVGLAAGATERAGLTFFAVQMAGGVLAGVVVGLVGGVLYGRAHRAGLMDAHFAQLALLALALLCWRTAGVVDGNGFVAAYVGGLAVQASHPPAGEHLWAFIESWGELLDYAVFFIFGTLVAVQLSDVKASALLYAFVSLTAVRMLPVAMAFAGAGLDTSTRLFVGWFGPRGVSSIVLGFLYLEREVRLPGEMLVIHVMGLTILLSIVAHELSARPLAVAYARRARELPADAPEHRMPPRVS